jgi:hypothetical protein
MAKTEKSASRWQVEDAGPEHLAQIQTLFKTAFKTDMSAEQWHWKYDDGRGFGMIVRQANEVVAYFGGMERRVLFKGNPVTAIQSGDVLVARQHCGTLSKKGPFFLAAAAFQDRYLGDDRPYLLSYGFPHERNMRPAERLGLYTQGSTPVDIACQAKGSQALQAEPFDFESHRHQEAIQRLWLDMASDFSDRAIDVRDIDYLRYRHLDHPVLSYHRHLVSNAIGQDLIGLLVTRQIEDRLILVDVVSTKRNIRHLISFGRNLAAELNWRELFGWITEVDLPLVGPRTKRLVKHRCGCPSASIATGWTR